MHPAGDVGGNDVAVAASVMVVMPVMTMVAVRLAPVPTPPQRCQTAQHEIGT